MCLCFCHSSDLMRVSFSKSGSWSGCSDDCTFKIPSFLIQNVQHTILKKYKKYLEEQKKKKGSETSTSGINVIEINFAVSSSDSWVFDTGSMIYTCKSLQGLSQTRRFATGELDVRVGN
jgi:hypothetical protein